MLYTVNDVLATYTAYTRQREPVTANATASASSEISYEDAWQIAYNDALALARDIAETQSNLFTQIETTNERNTNIDVLNVITAHIINLDASDAKIVNLDSSTAQFDYLDASEAIIVNLDSSTARFNYLEAGTSGFEYLKSGTAEIQRLISGTAEIEHLIAGTAEHEYLKTNFLKVNDESVTYLTGGTVSTNYLTAGTVSTNYLTAGTVSAKYLTAGTANFGTMPLYYTAGGYTAVKSFVIDHPLDQEKYLVHACLEGPESGVYYRGKGEIVDDNSVIIELPHYVQALASNFTVQVTPIYQSHNPTPNYSTSEVSNNSFTVYGKNGSFFWSAYGERSAINVEVNKNSVVVSGNGPYKYIN